MEMCREKCTLLSEDMALCPGSLGLIAPSNPTLCLAPEVTEMQLRRYEQVMYRNLFSSSTIP